MISAEFYLKDNSLIGFSVKGHAGYAAAGRDVVCAAVSSAAELTANGITEIVKAEAVVDVFENEVKLVLSGAGTKGDIAVDFLKAFRLQMELIAEEFPSGLRLQDMEV